MPVSKASSDVNAYECIYYIIPNRFYWRMHLLGTCKSQYLGITCVYAWYYYKILWIFSISNFRGLVPAPVIDSLPCFTALELKKSFELYGGYFKTPFGPSEKR